MPYGQSKNTDILVRDTAANFVLQCLITVLDAEHPGLKHKVRTATIANFDRIAAGPELTDDFRDDMRDFIDTLLK